VSRRIGEDTAAFVFIASLAEVALDDSLALAAELARGAGTSLPELLLPRKAEGAHG
jgi:hypothetical protein